MSLSEVECNILFVFTGHGKCMGNGDKWGFNFFHSAEEYTHIVGWQATQKLNFINIRLEISLLSVLIPYLA